MHVHYALHAVVALRGKSALAGWLKSGGQVKERSLHVRVRCGGAEER